MNFLYFAGFFELLDNSRKIAAAAMLELHAVSDLANGGGVRLSREVREHFLAA